jgi:hypothetical protein
MSTGYKLLFLVGWVESGDFPCETQHVVWVNRDSGVST